MSKTTSTTQIDPPAETNHRNPSCAWLIRGILGALLTIALAYAARMLEWPCWQNPEYRLGDEMLLATHDAYHWVAGAVGFGRAVDHPMAIMLKVMADICGSTPAAVAFWFPALLASLVAGMVYAWGWALGGMGAGIAAGLIATIAPGFLARTLLGFYDTDLITLSFPLLISIVPAFWVMRYTLGTNSIFAPLRKFLKRDFASPTAQSLATPPANPLSVPSIVILAIAGIISFLTQQWHSVFPYLIRYNVILLLLITVCMAAKGRRATLMTGSLCHSFPALAGLPGLLFPLAAILALRSHTIKTLGRIFLSPCAVTIFLIAILYLVISGDILNTLLNHANAYLKNSGDTHASGGVPLVFPSVAQSIIEVQDLSFTALFPYFHPWLEASILGMIGFIAIIILRPAALFLLPLAALAFSSQALGGRMVMFGAPVVALGLALPAYWLLLKLARRLHAQTYAGATCCALLCALLVIPFLDMIPALSQGPIINRRHAAALAQARTITPPDAMLWLWWDWGYAAHYFARRETIADGAQHGGPSLYLPAAMFATDNPRFARQIIRLVSQRGNEPGNFFKGLDAERAQELINRLRSSETPLARGEGRQFVVTSFEMLRLGFWISNYGNWNFITRQGDGGALSIVPQALSYRLKTGEVRLDGSGIIIFPTSITVFEETGVTRRDYVREWFAAHPGATARQQNAWLATRRNVNFLFNRVTDEKLAMDEGIYNSVMTLLLICDPQDPRVSPYFKLVYDNVFARIYEVLPAPAGS